MGSSSSAWGISVLTQRGSGTASSAGRVAVSSAEGFRRGLLCARATARPGPALLGLPRLDRPSHASASNFAPLRGGAGQGSHRDPLCGVCGEVADHHHRDPRLRRDTDRNEEHGEARRRVEVARREARAPPARRARRSQPHGRPPRASREARPARSHRALAIVRAGDRSACPSRRLASGLRFRTRFGCGAGAGNRETGSG